MASTETSTASSASAAGAPPVRHHGITCDECGQDPIMGTRFKSRYIYDYDLCETCFQDSAPGQVDDFVAFAVPATRHQTGAVGPQRDDGSILHTWSISEAVTKLQQTSPPIRIAYIRFNESFPLEDYQALQMALTTTKHLMFLWLHMCNSHLNYSEAIVNVALGIMNNTSIQRLYWEIPKSDRVNATLQVKVALRQMVQYNRALQGLYIKRPLSLGSGIIGTLLSRANVENGAEERALMFARYLLDEFDQHMVHEGRTVDPAEDDFARNIFEGLVDNCTLQKMRLDSICTLSNSTKDLVMDVLKQNATLKRLYVTFEGTEDTDFDAGGTFTSNDSRLDLLLAKNRGQWFTRLANVKASPYDRMALVLEALETMPVNQSVQTLYYLIQSFPTLINDIKPLLLTSSELQQKAKDSSCVAHELSHVDRKHSTAVGP